MVNRYELPQLQKAYFASGAYAQPQPDSRQYDLVKWPYQIHAEQFRRDTELLHESLTPHPVRYDDIPGQVFGNQLRQEKLSAQHLANLLYERAALYARHMKDITSSHLKVQEQLFCEKINSPQATRRQINLEGLLLRLESDRRKAELDFWKDTHDIRETLFEKAGAYQTSSHRARLLTGIGGYDGP